MCGKCVELDEKIQHYRRIGSAVTDQLSLDAIKDLIETLRAQKASLHRQIQT